MGSLLYERQDFDSQMVTLIPTAGPAIKCIHAYLLEFPRPAAPVAIPVTSAITTEPTRAAVGRCLACTAALAANH